VLWSGGEEVDSMMDRRDRESILDSQWLVSEGLVCWLAETMCRLTWNEKHNGSKQCKHK